MRKQKKHGAKIIAMFCVFCILFAAVPFTISAESDIEIEVTNVSEDIVTISGSAPSDAMVLIQILNPGVALEETTTSDFDKIQFMDVVFSKNGAFSRDIKIKTGTAPNKKEGIFTVLVSIDGELAYFNDNFVFYSNETKTGYVEDVKSATESELLEVVAESVTKLESIFETYSVSEHELYSETDIENLAKVICRQESRATISNADDVKNFLVNVLVLDAFENGSSKLASADGINFTEIWAADTNGQISGLYTNEFVNSLSGNGKNQVKNELFNADWSRAQFSDIYKKFENSMYYHLIKNNVKLGAGHIEKLVTDTYEAEYKAAGFDTDLLKNITNTKEKNSKLNSFLGCNASNLSALAQQFNEIMKAEYKGESLPNDNLGSGSSSGGGGGGFTGGGSPVTTPAPTVTPEPVMPQVGHPFADMAESQWANEAVEYLYKNGIVNGRSETQFAPNDTVTRAELVKMICNALDVAEATEDISFDDVNDEWFAPYIKNAAAAGIVMGDGNFFKPNDAITREDATLIIFRALGLESGGEITFADVESISDYAKDAVAAMVSAGLVNGMGDGTFAPKNTLTRAQAAQLIYNAIIKGGIK